MEENRKKAKIELGDMKGDWTRRHESKDRQVWDLKSEYHHFISTITWLKLESHEKPSLLKTRNHERKATRERRAKKYGIAWLNSWSSYRWFAKSAENAIPAAWWEAIWTTYLLLTRIVVRFHVVGHDAILAPTPMLHLRSTRLGDASPSILSTHV